MVRMTGTVVLEADVVMVEVLYLGGSSAVGKGAGLLMGTLRFRSIRLEGKVKMMTMR